MNPTFSLDDHFILKKLVNAAERNVTRKKPGYRHDEVIKGLSAYLKMIGGPIPQETLHANLPFSWPSSSTANKFISDKGTKIVEGKLRSE